MKAVITLLLLALLGLPCCKGSCYVCQIYAGYLKGYTNKPSTSTVIGHCHSYLLNNGEYHLSSQCNEVSNQHTTMWDYIQAHSNPFTENICAAAGMCPDAALSAINLPYDRLSDKPTLKTAAVRRELKECDMCRLVSSILQVSTRASEQMANTEDVCEKYCYMTSSQNKREEPFHYKPMELQ